MPFSKAFKENGMSLIVFLGVIIPLLLTMGPTGAWIQYALSPVKGAFKSISLIFDIPLLITFFAIVEGWKYLPHSLSGWAKLTSSSIGKFNDLGALLVFAFVSSRLLAKLGLGKEFQAIFNSLNSYSPPYCHGLNLFSNYGDGRSFQCYRNYYSTWSSQLCCTSFCRSSSCCGCGLFHQSGF